jgi:ferredoxin-NADP reductase
VEGTALLERLSWRLAEVVALRDETPRVRTLALAVADWPGHRAGQHVDVRLTAEDGYRAERSYSIASPPEEAVLALTVERLEDGEVSPFLTQELRVGDRLEVRGPIGGYFVWEAAMGGPLLLVAGGSGIVPLMAMLRHRAAAGAAGAVPARLLYSCRTPADVIYRGEVDRLADVRYTFTRAQPPGWTGYRRRVDLAMLAEVAWPPAQAPLCYVCGPHGFVEAAAGALAGLGHRPERIRTERFGPSG